MCERQTTPAMKIAERYGARIDDEGRLFVPGEPANKALLAKPRKDNEISEELP